MDDKDTLQFQVLLRHTKRFCNAGCVSVSELKTESLSVCEDQKIELRPALCIPEIRLSISCHAQDFFKAEALPGGA